MKILLAAPQPFYLERGTPIAVRLLAETLCDFGHEVDLLVYHEGEDISAAGLRLFRARRPPLVRHVPIGISWQKLACDVTFVLAMARRLWSDRYDAIHAVEEAVFPAVVLGRLGRCAVVYDMDSSLSEQLTDKWWLLRPLEPFLRWFERSFVRRAAVILPVCEDLAEKVRPWVGPQRVVVLPDVPMGETASSTAVDSLRAFAGDAAVLGLYVGNLERYQGIDLLIDALALMTPESGLQTIVIGGSAPDVARYRQRAEELGLAERVHFIGPRPVAHLNAYLEQADVLVSPRTLGQNTPMKVYSYMQSGKAILATNIRSHTQALDPTCAELVAPEAMAMAAGLERLAREPRRRSNLGRAAREKAARDYSLVAFRSRLGRAYAQLARD